MGLTTVEQAIEDIRNGRFVIIVDDEDRENEGDFAMAAEFVTPESINFVTVHGRGLICVPLSAGLGGAGIQVCPVAVPHKGTSGNRPPANVARDTFISITAPLGAAPAASANPGPPAISIRPELPHSERDMNTWDPASPTTRPRRSVTRSGSNAQGVFSPPT